jgi:tRNA(fMet)-specific endonuclease VapC
MSKVPSADIVRRLDAHGHECAIAAPVWHELTFGTQRLPRGRRRDVLEAYLNDVVLKLFTILPYDAPAARWHGDERARLESVGKSAPFVDGQIAAIAAVNELVLVTANVKDFARFKDLKVENWTRRRH